MEISWFKYPFVRLLLPFASGIALVFSIGYSGFTKNVVAVLLIMLCILLLLATIFSLKFRSYVHRWVFALTINAFFFLLGTLLVVVNDYKIKVSDVSNIECRPKYYVARLYECPVVKENSVKVILELIGIEDTTNHFHDLNTKIVSYFEKDEKSLSLKYGNCIVFSANPVEIEKPPNPEQFDYKDYMYKKGIAFQVYLKSDAWCSLDYNKSNFLYSFSYEVRDFLLKTMLRLGVAENEYAVASAILLGYDDSLPLELRQKYVAAGAMHILCVSGLHVGVVFMVFSYILVFLSDRKRIQSVIKQLLLLLLVWFYAFLAGLAPSILRSTIMISFVIIGNIINRKGVLLNSLAASAFILLCVESSNLFDIGFQLSYVAVIGIVVLQKPISRMFYSKYEIVNKIWEMTSVTIAAQIATTPFSIYYFHQFPIYFWLSNLFMTPISSIVIVGGMIMLLISFVPYVNTFVAWIVSKMIFVMNYGVSWIESLPYSIIKGIYINELQFAILLVILLVLLLMIGLKNKRFVILMMSLSALFLLINVNNVMKNNRRSGIIFYSLNNMTAVDFISGREHLIMTDSVFMEDESAFSYNIENFLVKNGLFHNGEMRMIHDEFDEKFVKKRKNVVTFNEKLFALCENDVFFSDSLDYRIPVDYMFVYGKSSKKLLQLLKMYSFDNLIIDASVPYYISSKMIEEAEFLGIKCHTLRDDGAIFIE